MSGISYLFDTNAVLYFLNLPAAHIVGNPVAFCEKEELL